METEKIKISIIAPVYNAEKYISRCLDSVINQTLKEIEIICINDGSTDNSLKILEEYASKDKRIIIINKKRTGAGDCRNIGLDNAKGKYIQFVDSDDYLLPQAMETCYNHAIKLDTDVILYYRSQIVNNEIQELGYFIKDNPRVVFSMKSMPHISFSFYPSIHNKFYKKEYLQMHNLKFENRKSCNDVYVGYMGVLLADKIFILEERLYTYRRNAIGNISSKRGLYATNILKAYLHIKKTLKEYELFELYEKAMFEALISNSNYELRFCNVIQKINFYLTAYRCDSKFEKEIYNSQKPLKNIFSVTKDEKHRKYNILGIKLKMKLKK